MIRFPILYIFVLLVRTLTCLGLTPAWGAEIVVLQSAGLPAYNSAQQGFANTMLQDVPGRGQKAILAHTITSSILSAVESPGILRQEIISRRPDLLLVIGSSSLALVRGITDIPILYLMVPFPESLVQAQTNITGIQLTLGATQQLEAFTLAVPNVKNIGLVYDPERTGLLVNEALDYASRNQLNIIALPVRSADEVPGQLASFKDRIDWLWMVPDLTVLTPQTVDYIMLFSLENRVPILTFADKYLDMGAVLSVSFDPYELGMQAGAMALDILHKAKTANTIPARVEKVKIKANTRAAEMLGVVLREVDFKE